MKTILLLAVLLSTTLIAAQNVPSYVPTNGLKSWWPYFGNANDISGNGNNGLVNGATLTTDRFGNPNSAYNFDGVDDYINVPYSPTLGIQQNFSSSMWIFMDGGSCNPRVYEIHETLNCGGYTLGFNGASSGARTLHTANFGSCSSSIVLTGGSSSVSTNAWHHIVLVFNGVSGIGNLYIDGNLAHTVSGNIVPSINYYGAALCIGNIAPDRCDWWGGKIDDLGFWNRPLTIQEIQNLYNGCADSIQSQPQNFTAYSNPGWANFKCKSTDTAATYQWQQNIGSGWSNLSNFGNYTGVTSDSLVITGVTSSMNNYGYRCIISSCTTDTSDVAVLTVTNGIGLGESKLDKLTVSPNPTNGFISLNALVLGTYDLLTLDGRVLESGTAKKEYDLSVYPNGVYNLRLSTDEGPRALKIVKQ